MGCRWDDREGAEAGKGLRNQGDVGGRRDGFTSVGTMAFDINWSMQPPTRASAHCQNSNNTIDQLTHRSIAAEIDS